MNNKTVRIRTKNFSANPLKQNIFTDKRVIVRLGSTTPTEKIFSKAFVKKLPIHEINTVNAIQNSRSKLLMKVCFAESNIPQAEWWIPEQDEHEIIFWTGSKTKAISIEKLPYPILAKRIFGFKGRGMIKLDNKEELFNWLKAHTNFDGWFLETYYNYSREYRLHCTQKEVFMVWRKLRINDTKNRWFFNSSNCNWIGENHKLFNKPSNWKEVEKAAIDALMSVGLDLGAIDIRIQSSREDSPKFIVCEVNSAPALGEQGIEQYSQIIKKIITYVT